MLPEAARHGIGGYDADDVAAVEMRLRHETTAGEGVLVVWPVVTAWTRKALG